MWIEGKTSCNFGGDTADDFQNTLKSGVVLCKTRSRAESYFAKHAQERSSTLQVSVTTIYACQNTLKSEVVLCKTRSRAESYFAKHAQERSSTLQNTLKSGVVLCKLANAIQPGAIKKINNAKMNFMMMENIENFCNFVQTKGVASQYQFVTIDLFEGKNMHQ
ncbi:predicted protein, partial [Nematostella vectensis]